MAIDAAKEIESSGKKARVVSAVCWELFEEQDEAYKNSVLPPDVTARVCCKPPFLHFAPAWPRALWRSSTWASMRAHQAIRALGEDRVCQHSGRYDADACLR